MADRIGWETKAALVVQHYQQLPEPLRSKIVVSAENYGQAGALELLGRDSGLGRVISPHNSYYLWSRVLVEEKAPTALLHLGSAKTEALLREQFESVEVLPGRFENAYVSSHEQGLRVYLCQGPKTSVTQLLEATRFYY